MFLLNVCNCNKYLRNNIPEIHWNLEEKGIKIKYLLTTAKIVIHFTYGLENTWRSCTGDAVNKLLKHSPTNQIQHKMPSSGITYQRYSNSQLPNLYNLLMAFPDTLHSNDWFNRSMLFCLAYVLGSTKFSTHPKMAKCVEELNYNQKVVSFLPLHVGNKVI